MLRCLGELWLVLCAVCFVACTSVEEQQAQLEHARTLYREQVLSDRTAETRQKVQAWQAALSTVVRAEFYRTEETLGAVVPPVKAVSVTGKELQELLALLRRGQPVPLPDAHILTHPGTEPLQLNDDGEVVPVAPSPDALLAPLLPDGFFAIDTLRFYDAQGKQIEPLITPFADIVSCSEAAQMRNSWTDSDRPFLMLDDADWQRYRKLPSYRRFVQRMKKAHSTGQWDMTPDFSAL